MRTTQPAYTVSVDLLARPDMQQALRDHDFAAAFRLMKKYDGASQDRIASPVSGLTQGRVSGVVTGKDHIVSLDLIERISDGLRIPGGLLRLAGRPWENAATAIAPTTPHPAGAATPGPAAPGGRNPGVPFVVERELTVDFDVDPEGWATVTYRHLLHNEGGAPFSRLGRELWFEFTNGQLDIEPLDSPDRSIMIQRIHDVGVLTKFACQIFPALQPGETAAIGYTCTGGRFVTDHYWRQSISRPTDRVTLRVRHRKARRLAACSATEERLDGSETSADASLRVHIDGDDVLMELTRENLQPNQGVTLRWDVRR